LTLTRLRSLLQAGLSGEAGLIGVGEILAQTRHLLPVEAPSAILAIFVLSGLGFLVDSGLVTNASFNLVISGVTIACQYILTRRLLEDVGYALPDRPRGLAFLLLGIVAGLGIVVGLLVLIVPGIVLLVRWCVSTPVLLSSETGIFGALQESWEQTEGHFWPILLSLMVVYLPGLAIFGAGLAIYGFGPDGATNGSLYAGALIANLALNGTIVAGWIATVAIFSLLRSPPGGAEVFE